MTNLAKLHHQVAEAIPAATPVVYLDYPVALNVGDLLIMLGTTSFFRKQGIRPISSRSLLNTEERLLRKRSDPFTIVLQGGGNFGDLYPHIQQYRERIVSMFPDRRIVIMPQTIHFRSRDALKESMALFSRHPDLHLFVRDRASLSLVAPFLGDRVKLVPDMAHQLWGDAIAPRSADGEETPEPLFFIRDDEEASPLPDGLGAYRHRFEDWGDIVSRQMRITKRAMHLLGAVQTSLNIPLGLDGWYQQSTANEVALITRRLARHGLWVTSRLHGFILGLLLDKPVVAIDNNYGKLSSYIDTWRDHIEPVALLRNSASGKPIVDLVEGAGTRRHDIWSAYRKLGNELRAMPS